MGKKSKRKQPKGKSTHEASPAVAHGMPLQFEVGDQVKLEDLTSTQYNGKLGKVVSLPKEKDTESRYGVLVESSPIAIRPRNISLISKQKSHKKSTGQLSQERDEYVSSITTESCAGADQLALMRTMMDMFMTPEKELEIFGRKIAPLPNFCLEMGNCFPLGADRKWGEEYLRLAFEQSSNLPHFFEMAMKSPEYKPSQQDIMKRLGTVDQKKLEWYFRTVHTNGEIYPHQVTNAYPSFMRHSFSNQTYRKEVLHQGTTHIAVGFVDLGILLAATLKDPPSLAYGGPLKFVGVEISAYSVAKTHVVWEMLKQAPSAQLSHKQEYMTQLQSITQLWFSSTWCKSTEAAVKAALISLCANDTEKYQSYHPDVREILEHWKSAMRMPLKEARLKFADVRSNAKTAIADLQRQNDRIAMAKYELTGDFGSKSSAFCGNTIMFDCPDGTSPLATDENVFSVIDLKELIEQMNLSITSNIKLTIIEAAEEYILSKVSKVADWACSGLVDVQLLCARVQDMVDTITMAKPYTMSWSNVLDYMDYAAFHHMARSCSINNDTIHFGYSMNWVTNVFGTNIIDFVGEKAAPFRAELFQTSNKNVEMRYRMLGWDKYLRLPPPTNPINTTSTYALEVPHFKNWTEHFFSFAKHDGPCQVANVEHTFGSPLSDTGGSTVSFTWTYDPDITFNAADDECTSS